jgi:DNA-binding MarR family transcriptional regulator
MQPLQPTLWRTCRVLANRDRLRVLSYVSAHAGVTVSQVAVRCGLAMPRASEYLRALQARGLIQPRRHSRWVSYAAGADPAVVHAAPILAAVQAAFARRDKPAEMLRAATAFTHPRRLVLAAALHGQPQYPESLARRCGFSLTATCRHLRKLERRGLVQTAPDGTCLLCAKPPPLLRDLLGLVVPAGRA